MADYAEKYAGLNNLKIRQLLGKVERLEPAERVALRAEAERRGLKAAVRRRSTDHDNGRTQISKSTNLSGTSRWLNSSQYDEIIDSNISTTAVPKTRYSVYLFWSVVIYIPYHVFLNQSLFSQAIYLNSFDELLRWLEEQPLGFARRDFSAFLANLFLNVLMAFLIKRRSVIGLALCLIYAGWLSMYIVAYALVFHKYSFYTFGYLEIVLLLVSCAFVAIWTYCSTRSSVLVEFATTSRITTISVAAGVGYGIYTGSLLLKRMAQYFNTDIGNLY